MKMSIESREDAVRFVMEHPVWLYFHMDMGLLDAVNENAGDMLDAVRVIGRALMYLVGCLLLAAMHIAQAVQYPIKKAMVIRKLMRDLAVDAPAADNAAWIKNESVRGF